MEKSTSETVGMNLVRAREQAQLSVRALSSLLVERGFRSSGSGVTDIEQGRRGVTVDQLTALASILDTSPMALLTPRYGFDAPREWTLAGCPTVDTVSAYLWLRGEDTLTDSSAEQREEFFRRTTPPAMWHTERVDPARVRALWTMEA